MEDVTDDYAEILSVWADAVYGKEWRGEAFAIECARYVFAQRLLDDMSADMKKIGEVFILRG